MTAVAVWQQQPDADALLEARLARGWTPPAADDAASCALPPSTD